MGGSSSSNQTGAAQAAQQAREALSDQLSQAADLESTCRIALEFALETLGRSSGIIMVTSSGACDLEELAPDLLVQQELSESWASQVNDLTSSLHHLAAQVFSSGESSLPPQGLDGLAAALPVRLTADILGVLLVQGEACSPAEIEQLTCLMPSIGLAIRSARLVSTLQDRARDLAKLQMDLTRMGFSTDFEGMQAQMIQGTSRILDGEDSALVLLDEEHEEWMVRKSLGGDSEWIYQVNPREGKGLVKECLRSGDIIRVNQVSEDPRFDPSSDGLSGLQVRSLLCAPLVVSGHVVGAIQVLNKRQGEFNNYDQDLLSMVAILAANAIHGTRTIQQIKVANAELEASRWELLGSRNTLRALFDNLPAALYIIDSEYKLIAVNKSRAQRSGQTPQALVGKLCYQALFNLANLCPECRVYETMQDGGSTKRSERRWDSAEDSWEWEISSYPILDERKRVVQAIMLEQDMTDRRRLEAILAQSEKLAAVGQLAAGVAHEINNPLTAIIANAQILHRELPPDHDLQESVDLIARAGSRATQVVRNLLDFSRKEEYHRRLTDLNETVDKALELVQHELLARSVHLEFDPDPNLPNILASQDHLQSVWLNLLLNAIDSIDKSPGEVKIATGRVGDEFHVSVTDNGKGIPSENLARIFEPFYTTKEPGRGTGLGLSVSHRIVKQHGGNIRVESQVGEGSKFTVVLPAS